MLPDSPVTSNFCFLILGSKGWLVRTPGPHKYVTAKFSRSLRVTCPSLLKSRTSV